MRVRHVVQLIGGVVVFASQSNRAHNNGAGSSGQKVNDIGKRLSL